MSAPTGPIRSAVAQRRVCARLACVCVRSSDQIALAEKQQRIEALEAANQKMRAMLVAVKRHLAARDAAPSAADELSDRLCVFVCVCVCLCVW